MPDDIKITGTVIDAQTQQGIDDVRIQAMGEIKPRGEGGDELPQKLGVAVTKLGHFSIGVNELVLKSLVGGIRSGKVFFRIYDKHDILLTDTEGKFVWRPGRPESVTIAITISEPGHPSVVRGRVVKDDGAAIAGVKAVAFQVAGGESRRLGEATSGDDGGYEIKYTPLSTPVHLRVKAFDPSGQEIGDSGIHKNVAPDQSGVDIVVPAASPAELVVKGTVRHTDGRPLVNGLVRAFDKDLRSEEKLGESPTDGAGRYAIHYSKDQFRRAEKASADLIVRAFSADSQELVASPILFNAGPEETVDLLVGGGRYLGLSEYEKLLEELTPVLQELSLADLREDTEYQDITFLESETGIARERIDFLRIAALRSAETQVPPEVFYAFFRQKLPTDLGELLKKDQTSYRKALENALKDNVIPLRIKASLDDILARLEQLKLTHALDNAPAPGVTPVRSVLATTLKTPEKQQTFYDLYSNLEGSIEEFWNALREHPEFKQGGIVDELQTTLRIGYLTHNHVPLVQRLQKALSDGVLPRQAGAAGSAQINELSDLAKLNEADWLALIQSHAGGTAIGFPELTPGETDAARAVYYAKTISAMMETAFPTKFVASRVADDGVPGANDLGRFFGNNPQFDIHTTRVDAYLAEHPAALAGVTDKEATVKRLNSMQRTYRLTASYSGMRALHDDSRDSARAISRIPMKDFTARYAEKLGGAVQAARVYQKAHRSAIMALALYGKFGAAINATELAAIPTLPTPGAVALSSAEGVRSLMVAETAVSPGGIPDWTTLFGSRVLSFCECEHCRSVYSPAAYLVDILNILKSRASHVPGRTAADILFDRRPDIAEIELSCNNTNTVLPYIDLVNELLEFAVSPGTSVPARQRQTTKSTAELLAYPEYLNLGHQDEGGYIKGAYDRLTDATYPWDLPFHLWWEEVRGYFEYLGIKREVLMETFQAETSGLGGGVTLLPPDIDIATERLGLTSFERGVITTADTDPLQVAADWGVGDLGSEDFSKVSTLLRRSGLTFEQLKDVLATDFIRLELEGGSYTIGPDPEDPEAASTCDTTELFVQPPPEPATLDRFHRFVRLWRKLGWSVQDVDRAITLLNASALGESLLTSLAQVKQLMTELKLPVDKMLDFWEAGLGDQDAKLAKALGIPLDDLQALITLTGINPFSGPAAMAEIVKRARKVKRSSFTVARLKYIYLHAAAPGDPIAPLKEDVIRLLKGLQDSLGRIATEMAMPPVPARELLEKKLAIIYDAPQVEKILAFLAGIPLDTPENRAFIDLHFPFADIAAAYTALLVLAPPATEAERDAYITGAISFALRSLLTHLRTSLSESLVKQTLSNTLGLDSAVTGLLLGSVLRSKTVATLPAMNDYLSLLGNGLSATYYQNTDLTGPPETTKVESTVDFSWGSGSPDPSITAGSFSARFVGKLFAPERDGYTFSVRTSGGVRLRVAGQLIIDEWGNTVPADFRNAEPLRLSEPEQFYDVVLEFTNTSPDAFLHLSWSSPSVPEEVIPPRRFFTAGGLTSLDPVLDSFTVLRKTALLISTFKVTSRELAYLTEHTADFAGFDLNALPVRPADFAPALFEQWERLRDVFALRDSLPRGDKHLIDLFAAATAPAADLGGVKALIIAVTGWDEADMNDLVGGFSLDAADFKNAIWLLRLREGIALRRRLGIRINKLFDWAGSPPDQAQAEDVRTTIMVKYDEAQWLEKARALRDVLRGWQRAALVSYLVARPDEESGRVWDDANGLYNYFLVDVEMSSCQPTSRIKLAISSVQLFIQRSLMNLEPDVSLSPEDAKHWREWMRNYRVWEANRKIFLYPENWIYPELRDDKSPFFKELENELRQNDITNESAEAALLRYLEKLDGVARLHICGMYHQQEGVDGGEVDILHVVARTFGAPSLYYYRKRIDSAYWTPWEKVDVDIEGDHLIPVVFNRRPYLFWPVFAEKAPKDVSIPAANTAGQKPVTFFEIKLAWSEYKDGKWSAKRVSHAVLTTAGLSPSRDDYIFKARIDNFGNLIFGCYTRRV